MHYSSGPLKVSRSEENFVFQLEIGQGAKKEVHRGGDLAESIDHLLLRQKSWPAAFYQALEELRELGETVDWRWDQIARQSEE